MSLLTTLEKHTPHLESMHPYGYRFENIVVYHVTRQDMQDLDLWNELKESHDQVGDIHIPTDTPHKQRIIWEIASHIEGCFGLPFHAVMVVRESYITIHAPQDSEWWNSLIVDYTRIMHHYLMGLRSLLDILK